MVYTQHRLLHLEAYGGEGTGASPSRGLQDPGSAPTLGGWRATFIKTRTGDQTVVTAPFVVMEAAVQFHPSSQHAQQQQQQQPGPGAYGINALQGQQSEPVRLLPTAAATKAQITAACSVRVVGRGECRFMFTLKLG